MAYSNTKFNRNSSIQMSTVTCTYAPMYTWLELCVIRSLQGWFGLQGPQIQWQAESSGSASTTESHSSLGRIHAWSHLLACICMTFNQLSTTWNVSACCQRKSPFFFSLQSMTMDWRLWVCIVFCAGTVRCTLHRLAGLLRLEQKYNSKQTNWQWLSIAGAGSIASDSRLSKCSSQDSDKCTVLPGMWIRVSNNINRKNGFVWSRAHKPYSLP
jgi:hypothetical protein